MIDAGAFSGILKRNGVALLPNFDIKHSYENPKTNNKLPIKII